MCSDMSAVLVFMVCLYPIPHASFTRYDGYLFSMSQDHGARYFGEPNKLCKVIAETRACTGPQTNAPTGTL